MVAIFTVQDCLKNLDHRAVRRALQNLYKTKKFCILRQTAETQGCPTKNI